MSSRAEVMAQIQMRLNDLQTNGTASDEAEMINLLGLLDALSMEEEEATLAQVIASSTPDPVFSTPEPTPAQTSLFADDRAPVPAATATPTAAATPAAGDKLVFTQDELNSMSESEIMAAILASERSEREIRSRADSFEDVHDDLNPFDVKCPFCSKIMPTFNFPEHVFITHQDREGEMHRCGICYLASNTSMGKVNLVEHLRSEHSDFVATEAPAFQVGYNIEVIDKDYPGECPVCWEPFSAGQTLTILSCLCRYHQKCIEGYWERDGHKPGDCAVHRDRDVPSMQ